MKCRRAHQHDKRPAHYFVQQNHLGHIRDDFCCDTTSAGGQNRRWLGCAAVLLALILLVALFLWIRHLKNTRGAGRRLRRKSKESDNSQDVMLSLQELRRYNDISSVNVDQNSTCVSRGHLGCSVSFIPSTVRFQKCFMRVSYCGVV